VRGLLRARTNNANTTSNEEGDNVGVSVVKAGHRDSSELYQRENDPARPMLTRLYGNE